MTLIQKLHIRKIIRKIARQQGITYRECYSDLAEVISSTWSTTNPVTRQHQIELVGDSHIPTPEELIFVISQNIY